MLYNGFKSIYYTVRVYLNIYCWITVVEYLQVKMQHSKHM